jgi:serine/threonine protein kinase/tetratricopeptide (TPR) repeat protein
MVQPPQPHDVADPSPMAPPLDPIASLRTALRGHYDIEREIGQGAFATVYLARDLKHERKVAIKVLHADPSSETGELRFIREIRLLARLQHPNILPLHDSGHVETLLYYVMPYVSGETLRDRIARERQLNVDVACNIARDAADALAYAHSQGIIHRDIKPENILLSAGHPIVADFGIARAIDLAGVRTLTRTGMGSPGTPAYMSPEQMIGDKELDGRSDTYSLGCVLFEMLTGRPPFTGKDGFVKRFTEAPPAPSSIRKDIPRWIDDVVTTTLAKSPNDRYQTAQELVSALSGATANNAEPRAAGAHPGEGASGREMHHSSPKEVRLKKYDSEEIRVAVMLAREAAERKPASFTEHNDTPWLVRARQHRTLLAAGVGIVLLVTVAAVRGDLPSLRNSFFGSGLDSTRLAVLPFAGDASQRERDRITNGLYATLSEWQGLRLASNEDVADAAKANGAPASTRAAAALARRLGAGRYIWGQIGADDDPSQSRAQLYDVSSDVALKSIRLPENSDRAAFDRVVHDLLAIPNRPSAADGGDGKTTSYSAWNAYGRGHIAFWKGDLATAEQEFQSAVATDPKFGPARVWLAQTLSLRRPDSPPDWSEQLGQALRAPSGLSEHDRLMAIALTRMSERRYPEACASYSALTKADSLDFIGLYGLGQCQAFDSLVVRSRSSPSGWRFQSRYSDAANAYMNALSVNPSAHSILSFDRVQDLLPTASTKTRRGISIDGASFAAYPALIHDTVVFIPYPLQEFSSLPANQTAVTRNAAIQANLDVLLDFTSRWTRGSPESSPAFLALAEVLDARGEIARNRSGAMSAMDAVTRARQLAATPREKQLAGTKEAWLRFKQADFAGARKLADSLLATQRPSSEEAETLIGLAALTGKIGKTAELARLTNDYAAAVSNVPIPVMDAAAPFFAFAVLGVCSDTTRELERRLDEQLSHYVAETQLPQLRRAIKARPLSMLAPCTGAQSSLGVDAGNSRPLRMEQAFARGDTRTLNSLLEGVANDAKTQRPGDVSLDFTYQVAWLRSAMGDTANAERQLDRALGALSSLSAFSLRDEASAAAAGRAMALRAELANARGEIAQRTKWARAVADLWATADPPLQRVVARMRSLAAQGNPK